MTCQLLGDRAIDIAIVLNGLTWTLKFTCHREGPPVRFSKEITGVHRDKQISETALQLSALLKDKGWELTETDEAQIETAILTEFKARSSR